MPDTQIYGLDIETDTGQDSIDPAVTPVVMVALSGPSFDEVFEGPEADLLAALDVRLATLAPGVIATWNGAVFDLPFIAERAGHHGVALGLRLETDPRPSTLHLPGHRGAYRAGWYRHRHLDTVRVLGAGGRRTRWQSLSRVFGRGGSAATGPRHDLLHEARHAHAPSDARLARVLAGRHWLNAARSVDLLSPAFAPAAGARAEPQPAVTPRPSQPAIAGL